MLLLPSSRSSALAVAAWVLMLLLLGCRELDDASQAAAEAPAATAAAVIASPLDRLPEDEAGRVVRRAIDHAGGWEAWEEARTLNYEKTTVTLAADGSERSRLVQRHRYALHPGPKMRIEYLDEAGREVVLVNDGDEAWKWVGGERVTSQEDRDHAWNSTFGSHYVMAMPFKLTDPGTLLSYAGRDTLDGVVVDAVRAEYEQGAGSAGGMHTWTYYFAAEDGRLVANLLRYGPNPGDYSFTEYHDVQEVGGIRIPMRRTSYSSNAAAEKLELTSAYINEAVHVNEPLDEDLFALSERP